MLRGIYCRKWNRVLFTFLDSGISHKLRLRRFINTYRKWNWCLQSVGKISATFFFAFLHTRQSNCYIIRLITVFWRVKTLKMNVDLSGFAKVCVNVSRILEDMKDIGMIYRRLPVYVVFHVKNLSAKIGCNLPLEPPWPWLLNFSDRMWPGWPPLLFPFYFLLLHILQVNFCKL